MVSCFPLACNSIMLSTHVPPLCSVSTREGEIAVVTEDNKLFTLPSPTRVLSPAEAASIRWTEVENLLVVSYPDRKLTALITAK